MDNINVEEVNKFKRLSKQWWDKTGPLRTLHDINPIRLQFIQTHVSLTNKQVLDIGCGGGILSEGLAKASAIVTGLDVEPDSLEVAKKHAIENNLSIDYILSPIEKFKPKALFDVITCLEMLEHVPCPNSIIETAVKHLKPGGYLFLSTINRTPKAYMHVVLGAEYLLNLLPKQTHDYKKFIKPSELALLLRQQDLEIMSLKGMSYHPLTHQAALTEEVTVNYLLAAKKTSNSSDI